ncbi:MAG: MFS transporter [Alphaproteobacteria bacterium]|nr:MFS transporter [Alphaproteobacteria bacterium]
MRAAEMKLISDYEMVETEEAIACDPRGSVQACIILGCAWIFYLYEYILRVSPSVMTNELMTDFDVTSTSLGVLASFYYLAYVPLQIPCGLIVDRLGARKVITFSSFLCILGCILFSGSETLMMAKAGRFLIGAGSACAYLSCAKIGAEWFHSDKFAVVAGMTMMMGTFGGISGGRPFAILLNHYGWRQSMLIAAAVGCCIALAAWLIIRDHPDSPSENRRKKSTSIDHASNGSLFGGLRLIASNPQNWLIGLYGCMMYLPLSAFAELWGVPFLMQVYDINNEIASTGTFMVFLGMALGCPLGAWLSNRFKSRIKIMSWSALGTLFVFCIVFYVPNIPWDSMLCLLFVGGLISGGQILYFAAAKEISPDNISGTTIGFTNFLVMISGFVFQPLVGRLLDLAWDGQMSIDGSPEYNISTYKIAFTAISIGLFVGWIIVQFVKETYNHTVEQV